MDKKRRQVLLGLGEELGKSLYKILVMDNGKYSEFNLTYKEMRQIMQHANNTCIGKLYDDDNNKLEETRRGEEQNQPTENRQKERN